jgi:hypothetical protein
LNWYKITLKGLNSAIDSIDSSREEEKASETKEGVSAGYDLRSRIIMVKKNI